MHYSRVPRLRRALAIPLLCLAFGAVTAPAGARPLPECVAAPCASDAGIPPLILAYWRGRTEPYLIRSVQRAGLPDDTPIYYGSYWGTGVNTRPPPTTPPPPPPPGPRPIMPNRRFAPIFTFPRTNCWEKRALTPEEKQVVSRGGITRKVPTMAALLHRSG